MMIAPSCAVTAVYPASPVWMFSCFWKLGPFARVFFFWAEAGRPKECHTVKQYGGGRKE